MITVNLSEFRPTTLAAMAADLSHYLTEEFDGEDCISAQEWDKVQNDAKRITSTLTALVGVYTMENMLKAADADPTHIF